jgi:hypothetical protein
MSNFASGAKSSPLPVWSETKPNLLASQIYEWGMRERSGVFARLMIRAITAAISSMIAVPATKTVTKAMSNAVLAWVINLVMVSPDKCPASSRA